MCIPLTFVFKNAPNVCVTRASSVAFVDCGGPGILCVISTGLSTGARNFHLVNSSKRTGQRDYSQNKTSEVLSEPLTRSVKAENKSHFRVQVVFMGEH